MTTIVIIVAILALLFCLIKAANSVNYQKWSIAAWIISVFLFGVFFDDLMYVLAITGKIVQFIFGTLVIGTACVFIWRLSRKF